MRGFFLLHTTPHRDFFVPFSSFPFPEFPGASSFLVFVMVIVWRGGGRLPRHASTARSRTSRSCYNSDWSRMGEASGEALLLVSGGRSPCRSVRLFFFFHRQGVRLLYCAGMSEREQVRFQLRLHFVSHWTAPPFKTDGRPDWLAAHTFLFLCCLRTVKSK